MLHTLLWLPALCGALCDDFDSAQGIGKLEPQKRLKVINDLLGNSMVNRLTVGHVYADPFGAGTGTQQGYTYDRFGNLTAITT